MAKSPKMPVNVRLVLATFLAEPGVDRFGAAITSRPVSAAVVSTRCLRDWRRLAGWWMWATGAVIADGGAVQEALADNAR